MGNDLYGPGYVYLIQRADGWYKIGRTANLEERFQHIRWEMGRKHELVLLCMCRVEHQAGAERMFHRIFQDKRSKRRKYGIGQGVEWFHLDRSDMSKWRKWADIIADEVVYTNITLTDKDWRQQIREIADG